MHTSEKVIVTSWLLVMFFLISFTFNNSFNENAISVEEPMTYVLSESIEEAFSFTDQEVVKTFIFYKPVTDKDHGISYGMCGLDDNDLIFIDPPPQISFPVQVADPLYGKDLYIFYIAQIVEQYYPNVDPYIALAILETESNYKPNLRSKAGAIGLMQIIPKYHFKRIEQYCLNDLWDPYTNIICGIDLINELHEKNSNWSTALLGYNNSTRYVKYVLYKADILRKDGCFG